MLSTIWSEYDIYDNNLLVGHYRTRECEDNSCIIKHWCNWTGYKYSPSLIAVFNKKEILENE